MKRAPLSTVVDFREEELRLPLDSPSWETGFSGFRIQGIIIPGELTSRVSTEPTAIHIHINIDIYIALDLDGHVRSGNRLPQSRSRGDGGQERNGDLEWR